MNPRQRVLRAIHHQEPDRVPIGVGSSGSAVHDRTYFALLEHFELGEPVEPFRRGHGDNHYDDRIFEALDSDIRHVFLNFYHSDHFIKQELGSGGLYDPFVDAWGVKNVHQDGMHQFLGEPLGGLTSLGEIKNYPWPDPHGDEGLLTGLRERTEMLREQGNYAIASRSPTGGIFDMCWILRGLERFMMDMYSNEQLVFGLIDHVTETIIRYFDVLLTEVGDMIDIIETQDDYGTQQSTFFSPEHFRKYFKPALSRLTAFMKEKAPQARVYLHTCGSVRKILPDLLEAGIEILNPIQPLAAEMETEKLKQDFGDQVVFYGAIDMQQAMAGSKDDVRREVRTRIRDLAPGGGYVLAPANAIHRDVPLENTFEMVGSAKKFGTYPIDLK